MLSREANVPGHSYYLNQFSALRIAFDVLEKEPFPSIYLRSHDNLLELIRRFVHSSAEHMSPSVYLMSRDNLIQLIRRFVYCSTEHTSPSVYLMSHDYLIDIQDSRLLYYLIREIKTWLNINHITVHNNTYFIF